MTREERLTLRAILGDFKKGLIELDYVEAHIDCLIEGETEELNEVAGESLRARGLAPQESEKLPE